MTPPDLSPDWKGPVGAVVFWSLITGLPVVFAGRAAVSICLFIWAIGCLPALVALVDVAATRLEKRLENQR